MKRWYVAQVYAGYEENIKEDLLRGVREKGLQEYFGEILVPSAKMKNFFEAEDAKDEQLFPGYILIEMEASNESVRLVTMNPRVIRFLGGQEPIPLNQKEVDRILLQMKGEVVVSSRESGFIVGSEVDIKEGAFAGFVGVIDEVDEEGKRLIVMVSIFGRMTAVKLNFDQVKR